MKRLYIIRHAKSSWDNSNLQDFERPLNARGERDAPFMGQKLAERGIKPDLILSSPANRAFKTAKIVAETVGYKKKNIVSDQNIYLSDLKTILKIIQNIDDTKNDVMIFGHNPCFTHLANYLSDANVDNIPTCGVFCVEFDIKSW